MDAAYCSSVLREHSRSLGHVPLIDHNPRRGEKIEFSPCEAQRYKERTQAGRTNARLEGRLWWQEHPGQGARQSDVASDVRHLGADGGSASQIADVSPTAESLERPKPV